MGFYGLPEADVLTSNRMTSAARNPHPLQTPQGVGHPPARATNGCRESLHEVHIEARLVNLLNIEIPSWAKDTSSAARMINARSETAQALRIPPSYESPQLPDPIRWVLLFGVEKTLGGETHS